MRKISAFRNTQQDYHLTNISNTLIKIIVKVIKTNYIKKIYENIDNNSNLLELYRKILSYNDRINQDYTLVDDTFTDILGILLILIKSEEQKAELETTQADLEATKQQLEATKQRLEALQKSLEGGRKRRSRKREIKRRGRKSRKH